MQFSSFFSVSLLSLETKEHEKWQQTRIDISLTSLKHTIVLDEDDEIIDEFPPLTEQQLQIIRYGLHGSRSEVSFSQIQIISNNFS